MPFVLSWTSKPEGGNGVQQWRLGSHAAATDKTMTMHFLLSMFWVITWIIKDCSTVILLKSQSHVDPTGPRNWNIADIARQDEQGLTIAAITVALEKGFNSFRAFYSDYCHELLPEPLKYPAIWYWRLNLAGIGFWTAQIAHISVTFWQCKPGVKLVWREKKSTQSMSNSITCIAC